MDDIRDKLMRRAYLYADAAAYRAGVEAAIAALQPQDSQDESSSDSEPQVLLSFTR